MRLFIKICGMTMLEDALFAISSGVDAVGFVAYPPSQRHVSPAEVAGIIHGLGSPRQLVGVFVNARMDTIKEYLDAGIDTIQLHGDEPADFAEDCRSFGEVWKAIRAGSREHVSSHKDYPCDKFLIDAFDETLPGGTGLQVARDIAKFAVETLPRPVILAGGLTPANFASVAEEVRPFGMDFNSGVESSPGVKDHSLIKKLFG